MTFKSKFLKEIGFFIVFSSIVFGVAEGVDLKGNKIQIKFLNHLLIHLVDYLNLILKD